jgi:hypothetical protein
MKKPALVVISNECCAKGCRRKPVQAEKMSDFWVARCGECAGKKITLDLDKIMAAVDATKRLKGKAA